jgi:hypothetical protein
MLSPDHTTTSVAGDVDESTGWARTLVDQLYLDARNQAVCTPTRRLRGQHQRLRAQRRHGRLTVWQTVQLAAAHQILLERGDHLAPIEDPAALYWNQPHA